MKEFKELKFVRAIDPNLFNYIPRCFFEQIKDYDFNVDKLIKYGALITTNPLTYIFVLIDNENKIKGILWSRVDIVDEQFEVYLLSVDKEYQDHTILENALDFIRNLIEQERDSLKTRWDINLKNKIIFITNKPKVLEKFGAKPSKKVLMEITNNGNKENI